MVESKYNYYAPSGDSVICRNGISKMIFMVKKNTFDFIKEILVNEEKQLEEPDVVEQLTKMHFLVVDAEKDTEYLINKMKTEANSSLYYLIVNPTQNCIFKCWYCYETHKESKMSEEILANIKKFVTKTLDRDDIDHFSLGWFGGEPLMYFNEIVYTLSLFIKQETEFKKKKFSCNMTTNGYLLTNDVIMKCCEIGLNTLQITLDGDESSHNRTRNRNGIPSFKQILENCIEFCKYSLDNHLILRINYTDKIIQTDFSSVLEEIPMELRQQITVIFKRVWQTYEKKTCKTPKGLLENQEKLQKMNFKQRYANDFEFVEGCRCYADRNNYVNLNFDGKVYKCTAVDYSADGALGYLNDRGDIVWNESDMRKTCSKLPVEDTKCLECNLLPICGGPCFLRKYNAVTKGADICAKNSLDTDVDMFLKDYYEYVQRNRKTK